MTCFLQDVEPGLNVSLPATVALFSDCIGPEIDITYLKHRSLCSINSPKRLPSLCYLTMSLSFNPSKMHWGRLQPDSS